MERLKHEYPHIRINRTVTGGNSRRRPDGLLRFKHFAIVIEIDENRHSSYDTNDEQLRLIDIYNDLQQIPTVVLRLNPDKYYRDGVCYYGCFHKNYTRTHEVTYRYNKLLYAIQKYIRHPPTEGIAVRKLFYSKQPIHIPDPTINIDILNELDAIAR